MVNDIGSVWFYLCKNKQKIIQKNSYQKVGPPKPPLKYATDLNKTQRDKIMSQQNI